MEKTANSQLNLYKDIQGRTRGEIYIGVVGPVRTGKSTFIKRFMDLCVLPNMEDQAVKERTIDELPQSAQGKTIMTTEPKFIPQEAARIRLSDNSSIKVRLVDCVGYMVDGASGHLEGEKQRMVKTPWFEEEIPFEEAARVGTEKVITDHATIGIAVTTDGTVGEIPRENYLAAEEKTVEQLKMLKKPFVLLLNSVRPYARETEDLAAELGKKYDVRVIPVNAKQMRNEDVIRLLKTVLDEFPVNQILYDIPKWTEMLSMEHPVKKRLVDEARTIMENMEQMRDLVEFSWSSREENPGEDPIQAIRLTSLDRSTGTIRFIMEVREPYYYRNISDMTGMEIAGEYEMIGLIRELSAMKKEYENVKDAMDAVKQKGYGVVMPRLSDISMEDPTLIQHGSKYGVKMKALSPSIHLIKANIETEIAPIVGSRQQAEDLIDYIRAGEQEGEGIWNTSIFGKSVGELMEDGIKSKIRKMDDECQLKLQDTMQKIVNESNGGLICLII